MPFSNQDYPTSPAGVDTAASLALARQRAYQLLSRLYLAGVTADLLPYIRALPPLAATLPPIFAADDAAAQYHQLFRYHLFPYESIFLDTTGLLGGQMTEAVLHSYHAAGLPGETDATSPDHLGHELALLAFLCAAEADAWADELPSQAARMQHQQQAFLATHLLRWLVPCMVAVQQTQEPFFVSLAGLTLSLAADHYAALPSQPEGAEWALPEAPDLLADEKTSLRDLASYLMIPAYSGLYVGRETVARLARELHLPRGFGPGRQMLTNLLRAAGQYEGATPLFAALQSLVDQWLAVYAATAAELPSLAPFVAPWQARAAQTRQLLATMQQLAGQLVD